MPVHPRPKIHQDTTATVEIADGRKIMKGARITITGGPDKGQVYVVKGKPGPNTLTIRNYNIFDRVGDWWRATRHALREWWAIKREALFGDLEKDYNENLD